MTMPHTRHNALESIASLYKIFTRARLTRARDNDNIITLHKELLTQPIAKGTEMTDNKLAITGKDIINVELSKADRIALAQAIHTQVKSLERAARAQRDQNRSAMADIYTNEANALLAIKARL